MIRVSTHAANTLKDYFCLSDNNSGLQPECKSYGQKSPAGLWDNVSTTLMSIFSGKDIALTVTSYIIYIICHRKLVSDGGNIKTKGENNEKFVIAVRTYDHYRIHGRMFIGTKKLQPDRHLELPV